MNFSARIAELQTQLTKATEDLDRVTAERDQAIAANEKCQERFTTDQATITTLTTERDQARTDLQAATEKLTAMEKNVEAEVTKRIAAAGVPPIARDKEQKEGNAKEDSSKLSGFDKVRAATAAQLRNAGVI